MKNLFDKLKLNESTVSMILGAIVVIVIGLLIFSYFSKVKNGASNTVPSIAESTGPTSPETTQATPVPTFKGTLPTTHKVKAGEDLWHIALNYYGSGYNWVDIANANKLANPGVVYTDDSLTIPKVTAKVVESVTVSGENTIKETTYTVVKGDNLWQIAVRAYGDGFRYTDIANANKLANPNLIFAGNVLSIPR